MADRARFGFDPGSVFGPVAASYQATRPTYPEALYDAIERIVGPLGGRRVLDVGAGTGISGRALAARGANVAATDPDLAMARTLRAQSPPLPSVLGRAEALPVKTGWAQLVTFAQAWHWVDVRAAALECRRVMGADGRLALWWNVAEDEPAFHDDLEAECGIERYGSGYRQDDRESLVDIGGFSDVVRDAVWWDWSVPVEQWLAHVATRSVLARLGSGAAARIGAIEAVARRHFPDGVVTERFTTRLVVAAP